MFLLLSDVYTCAILLFYVISIPVSVTMICYFVLFNSMCVFLFSYSVCDLSVNTSVFVEYCVAICFVTCHVYSLSSMFFFQCMFCELYVLIDVAMFLLKLSCSCFVVLIAMFCWYNVCYVL